MTDRVFEGLKVLDFCWVIVGPMTTRFLADHGATVVRVESTGKLDYLRASAPFKDNQPGINRSLFYNEVNTSKLSLGLNMKHPAAASVVRRLIERWQPDLLTESFGVGVMESWGLDYESVRRIRPDIVYFSSTQFGQTGPFARYSGFGNVGAAISGLTNVTGWPDGAPVGAYGALPDMTNPPLGITAILAALDYRERTGKGQRIDLAQAEGFLHYFAPAFLDYSANGRVVRRRGNFDDAACPHGVFPAAGTERWFAIAIQSDEEWLALAAAIGEEWAGDARFATFAGRRANEEELERRLGEWTQGQDAWALMDSLQAARVAAAVVNSPLDLVRDPHLLESFFVEVEHPELGAVLQEGQHFNLCETPAQMRRAPLLGEHNLFVLRELAGYTEEEIADQIAAGLVESP